MWLFTTIGFFSIVDNQDSGPDEVTVRARVREDLDAMREKFMPELTETLALPGRDYQYRAYISKADFAVGMARVASAVSYDNFKSEVGQKQGHGRASVYSRVWSVLYNGLVNPTKNWLASGSY